LLIASLALSWVSVSAKRALTELPSNCTKSALTPACCSAASMRDVIDASILTVTLALETCTAGASGNRLGSV